MLFSLTITGVESTMPCTQHIGVCRAAFQFHHAAQRRLFSDKNRNGLRIELSAGLANDFGARGVGHERSARHDAVPDVGMGAHDLPFAFGELSVFKQNGIGDTDLADIVQQRAPVDLAQLPRVRGEVLRQHQGIAGNAFRVQSGLTLARIKRGCQCFHQSKLCLISSGRDRALLAGIEKTAIASPTSRQ